jgi:2-polyprenyl-6-hydroxyphenyl methylase/3-demethylubiquinone-9 3-methyltransferase
MSSMAGPDARSEIETGERFAFGANWLGYLALVDDERIQAATASLTGMLGSEDLAGKRFLDIGSGSGLFSLAARRLGAEVVAFDFDPDSVAATGEMKRRFVPEDDKWQVLTGSVLDQGFLAGLGTFDVVYAWGVLHATGDMYQAIANAAERVAPGGQLFLAIYNDQGLASRAWARVKRSYNKSSPVVRRVLIEGFGTAFAARRAAGRAYRMLTGKPRPQGPSRGMSARHDLIDWIGGWPFQVAKPEEIFDFCRQRGFSLERLKTWAGGSGCNEYVFRRVLE